jgi:outer membrane protein TolC
MHKLNNKLLPLFVFALLHSVAINSNAYGQSLPPFKPQGESYRNLSLKDYLEELNQKNSSIKNKNLLSDSAVSVAKQAGRPNLSPILTYARGSIYTQAPYTGYTNPASNTLGATVTIEGWGKRSARESHAQAEANKTMAETAVEKRSTETQAILNYIDALRTKLLWQSAESLANDLKSNNSSEAKQKIEELTATKKTLENDLKYYSLTMLGSLGEANPPLPLPVGTLSIQPRKFEINELLANAMKSRDEVAVNQAGLELASTNLDLIKTNKSPDFLPSVFYTQTPPYASGGLIYGTQNSVSLLISMTLGNSLINNSEEIAASNAVLEQENAVNSVNSKIYVEINQTYLQYLATQERVEKAEKAYNKLKSTKNKSFKELIKFHDAESELIDAQTVCTKTMLTLQRMSGNYEIPTL